RFHSKDRHFFRVGDEGGLQLVRELTVLFMQTELADLESPSIISVTLQTRRHFQFTTSGTIRNQAAAWRRLTSFKPILRSLSVASSWPPIQATSWSTPLAAPVLQPTSPSNGAAAGSPSTPPGSPSPVPALWAHATRTTCWPTHPKASSKRPRSR